jgi:hypothetical protein
MGKSRNTFNTTLKKTGRLDKMIAFSVLTIVTLLVCVSVITLWRELRHPIFLEVIVELTHLDLQTVLTIYSTLLYDIWLDKSLCTFVSRYRLLSYCDAQRHVRIWNRKAMLIILGQNI